MKPGDRVIVNRGRVGRQPRGYIRPRVEATVVACNGSTVQVRIGDDLVWVSRSAIEVPSAVDELERVFLRGAAR